MEQNQQQPPMQAAPQQPQAVAQPQMTNMPAVLQPLTPAFKAAITAFQKCGKEKEYARESNFAVMTLMGNDYLRQIALNNPQSFLESINTVALTGLSLNPALKLGYLVPRKGKVVFQSSYMGKLEILYRNGVVKKAEANLVYENDDFDFNKGSNSYLAHKPNVFGDRGQLLGGYYYIELANGGVIFDVMPKRRIDEIKSRSESVKAGKSSPWVTDYEEMARKTVLNWGFKFIPKTDVSEALLKVLETDDNDFSDWVKDQSKPLAPAPKKSVHGFADTEAAESGVETVEAEVIE